MTGLKRPNVDGYAKNGALYVDGRGSLTVEMLVDGLLTIWETPFKTIHC